MSALNFFDLQIFTMKSYASFTISKFSISWNNSFFTISRKTTQHNSLFSSLNEYDVVAYFQKRFQRKICLTSRFHLRKLEESLILTIVFKLTKMIVDIVKTNDVVVTNVMNALLSMKFWIFCWSFCDMIDQTKFETLKIVMKFA